MSEQPGAGPDSEREDRPEPTDAEMGEPIAELAQIGWPAGDDFHRKVSGSIERRLLTGRLLDVAWTAPLMVLLELLRAPFESLSGNRRS